eukprot:s1116_g16.t1
MNAVEAAAKRSDGVSPMTPNEEKKDDSDEDAEAVRAAKRARLGDEEEKEELVVDAKSIRLAMEGVQRALDYVARQQLTILELQRQMLEIGSTANHSDSCQRYSLVCVQKAAENLKNGVWQLTGNKHEEKTTLKSMVQQLVTCPSRQEGPYRGFDPEELDDRALVVKCLHYVQSSLEYTARQAQALKECQEQVKEVGSVAYMGESCQKYSLAAVNAAAGHMKALTWQMTGSRSEERVSCKSLIQQLLTNSGKTVGILVKMSESLQKQAEQSAEQHKHFSEVLLAIQGQIADHFARGAAAATPTTASAPGFPPVAPNTPCFGAAVTGVNPVGVGIGGYGASAPIPATVPASFPAPAPPPPATPAPARTPITLQLRQSDGTIQQRLASPTPYRDESLRNNANYVFCDDRTHGRLV